MRIKTFAAAVTGAMALLVVGVPGALAQGPINLRQGLELTEAGAPVAPGATVFNEDLVVGQCFVEFDRQAAQQRRPDRRDRGWVAHPLLL